MVEGLAETRYEVTELPDDCLVTFRVQAVDADGNPSEWSGAETVAFGSLTGVGGVLGGACGKGDGTGHGNEVFDLQGRRIARLSRHGFYIEDGQKRVK